MNKTILKSNWQAIVLWGYFIFIYLIKYGWIIKLEALYLSSGFFFSFLIPYIDCLLFAYFKNPQKEISLKIKEQIRKRIFFKARELILEIEEKETEHFSQSFLGGSTFFLLAFFSLTSSTNLIGKGLTLGLYFLFVLKLINLYLGNFNEELINTKLFWNISIGKITRVTKKFILFLFLIGILILTFLFYK